MKQIILTDCIHTHQVLITIFDDGTVEVDEREQAGDVWMPVRTMNVEVKEVAE